MIFLFIFYFFLARYNFGTLTNTRYYRTTLYFLHWIRCFSPEAAVKLSVGLRLFDCIWILLHFAVKPARIVSLTSGASSSTTRCGWFFLSHKEIWVPGSEILGALHLVPCWQGPLCLHIPFQINFNINSICFCFSKWKAVLISCNLLHFFLLHLCIANLDLFVLLPVMSFSSNSSSYPLALHSPVYL